MACRRCSECTNSEHHWIDNPDFGNDPGEAEHPVNVTHICKHCDATGSECDDCAGEGITEHEDIDSGREFDVVCPTCSGHGVVLGKTVEIPE